MKKNIFNLKEGIKQIQNLVNRLKEKPTIIIAVAGGSCVGKGYISKIISETIEGKLLPMDDYYLGLELMKDKNFDSPEAMDLNLLRRNILALKQKKAIRKPIYDFATHRRLGYQEYKPAKIITLDGLFALSDVLRKEIDIKIFVKASEKIRLARRIKRDVAERGRTKESVIKQWYEVVGVMHQKYIKPQEKSADLIIINE